MKNFTQLLIKILIKREYKSKYVFLFFFFTSLVSAQLPTGIIWNGEVGCEEIVNEFDFDVQEAGECVKACQGSTVTYTLGGGDTQNWINAQSFVNGGSVINSSTTSITVEWGSGAVGELIFKIQTMEGLFTRKLCIELLPKPIVDFTIFPNGPNPEILKVCKNEIVHFENLSQTNGGSQLVFHNWYFSDDDVTTAEFEPTHVFQQSGVYTVNLTVTNACNCSASKEIEVHVQSEGLQIECNSIACENEVETYNVTNLQGETIGCDTYEWIIEGGDIVSENEREVNVIWDQVDQDGFGYVTYNPISCEVDCTLPVTIRVPVIKNDIRINEPNVICEDEQVRFSIPQWPSTEVEWKVTPSTGVIIHPSDQPNEVVLEGFQQGQNYILEAIYNNTLKGCGGVSFRTLSVNPNLKIEGPITVCEGDVESYTISNGSSAPWTLIGPNGVYTSSGESTTFTHTFSDPGLYTLQLEERDCSTPITIEVKPKPEQPMAIDGSLEICPGLPVTYTVSPPPPDGVVPVWTVGNGIFSSTQNQDAIGEEVTVIWNPNPNPSFTYDLRVSFKKENCVSEAVRIEPTAIQVDYSFTGNQNACASSYEIYSVDYLEGDKYEWEIITPELGSIAENPQDHEVEVLWNNVTTVTTAILELSIEKCGSKYTEQYSVVIEPTVPISINAPLVACRDEMVNFSISGQLTTWNTITWNFGDGTTATGPSPTHIYDDLNPNDTNYTVSVTVTEPNGCTNTTMANMSIQVQPAPVAHLTPALNHSFCDQGELNADPPTFNLTLDNNYAAATIKEWYRDTGSGPVLVQTGSNSYTATQFGEYYVIVESANGCTDTTNIINVYQKDCTGNNSPGCLVNEPSPTITSAQMTGCNSATATAIDNGNSTPIGYSWYIDNDTTPLTGQSSSTANFGLSGVGVHQVGYTVEYSTVDNNGDPCTFGVGDSYEVIVPYEAQLEYSITCSSMGNGYDVTMYDASDYFPSTPIQNLKYFVDTSLEYTGTAGQVTVSNLSPGSHSLELEISGSGYSPCSVSVPIVLPDLPTASINAVSSACAGEPVQFAATVNDPNISYEWDFGDGASNSLPDPIRNFGGFPVNPLVSLTITNQFGCTTTTTMNPGITINTPNMEGDLTLNPAMACEGNPIKITYNPNGQQNNIMVYYWNREVNGVVVDTQTTTTDNIDVTESGIYVLDGEDNNGCMQYGIFRISVTFLEQPTAQITGPSQVCLEDPFTLYAHPEHEDNYYSWSVNG